MTQVSIKPGPLTIALTTIPAGTFFMGEADDTQTIHLDTFKIGTYSITNLEYQTFINATGHVPPTHWPDGCHPPMLTDHPVVNVTWFDALAFCRWLTEVTGQLYRLPTEAEWEKAARGPEGNVYPWGNTFYKENCNTWETGHGQTIPVNALDQGASIYGVMNMVGNVWEWCSSLFMDYPYRFTDHREDVSDRDGWRILRGGSWYDTDWGVRAARRWGGPANSASHNTGFRIVCALEEKQ